MSRKLILTIATAATVAVASFASQSAEAHGGFGGFGGGRGFSGGRTFGGHGFAFGGARSFRGVFHHPINVPVIMPVHLKPIIPHFPLAKLPTPTNHHWAYHDGHWSLDVDVGGDVGLAPAVVVTPAAPVQASPSGCLTKTYTPTALVVFADTCTGESASAPLDSAVDAAQTPTSPVSATATPIAQVPTAPNYAGRTYADFLAANPQFAHPQATNAQPQAVTAQPEAAQD